MRRAPAAQLDTFLPLLQQTLENLRAGAWWLSAEERRFHDAELRRLLQHAGAPTPVPADVRFGDLDAIAHLVRRSPPSRRDTATHTFERGTRGAFLIVWAPSATDPEQWMGMAVSTQPLADLLGPVLTSLQSGQPFRVEVRDDDDNPVWSQATEVADGGQVEALRTVPGWKLVFSSPTNLTGIDQRRWLWYGFIGLLLVMLMTAWR